jgi:hypothetical protein
VGCDLVRRRAFGREPARRRRVQRGPLAGREICLNRRPDDRVHEAQRSTRLEDPGGGELVGRGRGGSGVDAGEARREPKVGLAEHGRRSCQLAGGGGKATQALHDRLRDRPRREGRDP